MVGIDLVEVARVQEFVDSKNESQLLRVFTSVEIEYANNSKNKYQRYAGRFAVKEAFFKAFGFGNLNEIEYTNHQILLYGETLQKWQDMDSPLINVSVSHTDNYATAIVIR